MASVSFTHVWWILREGGDWWAVAHGLAYLDSDEPRNIVLDANVTKLTKVRGNIETCLQRCRRQTTS